MNSDVLIYFFEASLGVLLALILVLSLLYLFAYVSKKVVDHFEEKPEAPEVHTFVVGRHYMPMELVMFLGKPLYVVDQIKIDGILRTRLSKTTTPDFNDLLEINTGPDDIAFFKE